MRTTRKSNGTFARISREGRGELGRRCWGSMLKTVECQRSIVLSPLNGLSLSFGKMERLDLWLLRGLNEKTIMGLPSFPSGPIQYPVNTISPSSIHIKHSTNYTWPDGSQLLSRIRVKDRSMSLPYMPPEVHL